MAKRTEPTVTAVNELSKERFARAVAILKANNAARKCGCPIESTVTLTLKTGEVITATAASA